MATVASIQKNERRKKLCNKYAAKRIKIKKQLSDKKLSFEERMKCQEYYNNVIPRNASPVRKRNRCFVTGKPRGYCRRTHLSRNLFRDFALKGLLSGVIKASW